jgi:hypothetical protein
MFKENIDFIRQSVQSGNPEYGIVSLTADTLDAMRSYINDEHFEEIDRVQFLQSMGKIIEGMYGLDELLDKLSQ